MPKPVGPNMATATPRLDGGPRRRRSSTPGRSRRTRSHLRPESVFPRARHGRSLPRRGERTRRWRLRDARGLSGRNDFLAPGSQAHLPSCNRQATPTSVHIAEPGPAAAPRGHAPPQRAHCLWPEQFQIADYLCLPSLTELMWHRAISSGSVHASCRAAQAPGPALRNWPDHHAHRLRAACQARLTRPAGGPTA